MNWYRIIKLSDSPIVEDGHKNKSYIDIGHGIERDLPTNYLWFIDESYNFYKVKETEARHGVHGGWTWFNDAGANDNILAKGRYDKKKHEVSFYINIKYSENYSKFRLRYIEQRVGCILDREFDNPTITYFP